MSKKCRNLTEKEIELMFNTFKGEYAYRNRVLFEVGLITGLRVAEICSLRIKDVMEFGKIKSRISVEAKFMKNKKKSREVGISDALKETLEIYIKDLFKKQSSIDPNQYLFFSEKAIQSGENRPLTPKMVWHIMNEIKKVLQLEGSIGTHCMRKTYATDVWEATQNIYEVMIALGHDSVKTTTAYVPNILSEVIEKTKEYQKGKNYGHKKSYIS